MNYRSRWKQRKTKLLLQKFVNIFQFRSLHLPFSAKIILVWNILLTVSLFQAWVVKVDENITWNSFASLSWNIGYPLLLWILAIFFFILSSKQSNNLKFHSNISFQNHSLIGIFGIFSIIATLISISFIHGFQSFSENISYGSAVNLALTAWIIITAGAYIMRSEYKKQNVEIFVSDSGEVKEVVSHKNNMKLPF